jgi:esterase
VNLFYRTYGNGPPLIILHGLYGSSDNWGSIAKSLSNSFTVYLPDQRNHGQSPHDDQHDYNSMRDDLYELVIGLKLKKFFLAGHSMGGKTAISFALKWPEMINGLLIADISPFTNENSNHIAYNQHIVILKAIQSVDLSMVSSRTDAHSILKEKISSEKVIGFILKNLKRSTGSTFIWKLNAQSLLNNLEKIMEGVDRYTKIGDQITGFPVFFLKGSESDYLPSDDFKDIQNIFPAAELVSVSNAGHWIHSDRPDVLISYLKRLLDNNYE